VILQPQPIYYAGTINWILITLFNNLRLDRIRDEQVVIQQKAEALTQRLEASANSERTISRKTPRESPPEKGMSD
jgi:hypothetical protein